MSNKIEKLNELTSLFNSGAITKEEFDTLKKEILNSGSEVKLESVSIKEQKKKEPEKLIWSGNPSQISMAPMYAFLYFCALCFLVATYVIPALFLLFLCSILGVYLVNKFVVNFKIRITTHRITMEGGIFSKTTEELELFRVKDIQLDEPFFLRMYGLSNITLISSDRTSNILIIPAIKDGKKIREELRNAVDERREAKGVREFDDARF